ncbi:MAG: DUF6514 family protein [Oscillospiraceae bacterium]
MKSKEKGWGLLFLYKLFEQTICSEEMGEYRSFGIRACRVSESGEEDLLSVSDVSADREFAEKLVEKFNEFQLSPIHLREATEDALGI